MKPRHPTRRALLRGAGAALSLPMMPSLLSSAERAHAAALPARPRYVAIYAPCGAYLPAWVPTETGPDWTLTPSLSPLSQHKHRITVVSGLDATATHSDLNGFHRRATSSWLTCEPIRPTFDAGEFENGWSFDQLLADARDAHHAVPSIQLAPEVQSPKVEVDHHYSSVYMQTVSWRGSLPLIGLSSPADLWRRLVGTSAADFSEMELTMERLKGGSVLDRVLDDLASVQQRIGAEDHVRLEEYLQGVRQIERQIDGPRIDASCGLTAPTSLEDAFIFSYENNVSLMSELLVKLLACDLTRIATMMLSAAEPSIVHTNLGHTDTHHWISHHHNKPELVRQYKELDLWQSQELAHFLDHLAAATDGAGNSLIDNTCVLYGSGIGDGMIHETTNLPTLVIGDVGGRLRTGSHIKATGRPLADLHLTISEAFDLGLSRYADSEGVISELLA